MAVVVADCSNLPSTRALLAKTGSDSVLVGLSGGKDSLVTLDLSLRHFSRVEAFFMYLVEGLRCAERYVDWAERCYQIAVHRLPHWLNSIYLRQAIYTVDRSDTDKIPRVKLADVEAYLRERTGIQWIAYGDRMAESLWRRGRLSRVNGLEVKFHRVFPIYDWSAADVYAYLRGHHIPIPHTFNVERNAPSGASLDEDTLLWIHDHYPDDFERIKAVYPFVEAVVKRRDFASADACHGAGAL